MTNASLRILVLVVFLIAGVVILAVAGDSTTAVAVGLAATGVGCVLLVALAFYEVGRSEDRAREEERRSER
jgi:hypothetical protein